MAARAPRPPPPRRPWLLLLLAAAAACAAGLPRPTAAARGGGRALAQESPVDDAAAGTAGTVGTATRLLQPPAAARFGGDALPPLPLSGRGAAGAAGAPFGSGGGAATGGGGGAADGSGSGGWSPGASTAGQPLGAFGPGGSTSSVGGVGGAGRAFGQGLAEALSQLQPQPEAGPSQFEDPDPTAAGDAPSGSAAAAAAAAWRPLTGQPERAWCSLNPVAEPFPAYCAPGLVCYPTPYLSRSVPAPAARADPYQARIGVCARPVAGLLLPARAPDAWPVPAAYFPLSEGSVAEFPVPYASSASRRAAPAPDGRFGSALACNASAQSFVAIRPAKDFAADG
ncbi:hypothetical protein Rsub_04298 [Raphidocelis subcapitata]|uniref:Uncharacterized protein n=1 Tax=Raphidocelis subcapitata TaxID=307507 RepID=A0A2V0NV89_9CHLO|nr:hypothetical protein Rsub_04298 [Raphidocelis subcapitata]|eukprot:GBF91558.1 hypothetical protein Rsub_04298 [Raphidocelis subcapitata]